MYIRIEHQESLADADHVLPPYPLIVVADLQYITYLPLTNKSTACDEIILIYTYKAYPTESLTKGSQQCN